MALKRETAFLNDKAGQVVLQNKERWVLPFGAIFITKWDNFYSQVWQKIANSTDTK